MKAGLTIGLRIGDSFQMGESLVTVVSKNGAQVKLNIVAPPEVIISRIKREVNLEGRRPHDDRDADQTGKRSAH